jgi:diketogulonate reductase-like aldo/keto reductase
MQEIPKLGFGTYRLKGDKAYFSVLEAVKTGYRHIDTASLYGNESEIGKALKQINLKREELWITTKISTKDIRSGKEAMYRSVVNSLTQLATEYIDLVLLHGPTENLLEAWKVLEEIMVVLQGKIIRIGVSNFDVHHLETILQNCKTIPYCNQFEINPYLNRDKILEWCLSKKILPVAHTSLVKGEKFSDQKLEMISQSRGISKPHLLLAWGLQNNMTVIPRSSNPEHISENFLSSQVLLSEEDLLHLNNFHEGYSTHPQYIFI